MAKKNKATLSAEKDVLFADNTSGDITPLDLRDQTQDDIDSFLNLASGNPQQTVESEINFTGGFLLNGNTIPPIDLTGVFDNDHLQYVAGDLVPYTPTDGVVKVNNLLTGVTLISAAPAVTVVPDDIEFLNFSSFSDFPNNVSNDYPLANDTGLNLLQTFVEPADILAGSNVVINLADDISAQPIVVTRTPNAGIEVGLNDPGDYQITGASQITVNTVNPLDTIKVYASLSGFIYDKVNQSFIENILSGQYNIWRILIDYTKSGTQSGNFLTLNIDNPNPGSSFFGNITYSMPGGAQFQTNQFPFVFISIGDSLSIPGLGDPNAVGYNFTLRCDGGNNVTINSCSITRITGFKS